MMQTTPDRPPSKQYTEISRTSSMDSYTYEGDAEDRSPMRDLNALTDMSPEDQAAAIARKDSWTRHDTVDLDEDLVDSLQRTIDDEPPPAREAEGRPRPIVADEHNGMEDDESKNDPAAFSFGACCVGDDAVSPAASSRHNAGGSGGLVAPPRQPRRSFWTRLWSGWGTKRRVANRY